MAINRLVGIVLVIVGIILLFFGWQGSQSMADQVSETFTGRFTEGTMWYIIGGATALVAGAVMLVR